MNNNRYNGRVPSKGHPSNHTKNRRRRRKRPFPWGSIIIVLLTLAVAFGAIWHFASQNAPHTGSDVTSQLAQTEQSTVHNENETETEAVTDSDPIFDPNAYTEMTLLVTGDVMYHNPQLDAAYDYATGEYDFTNSYKYIKPIVSAADYAVANFESTLAGNDSGYVFQGYPTFNTPDTGLSCLVDAGFDMMLYANNHCYDTQSWGLIRTQEMFNEMGIDYIGARLDTNGKTYKNVEINGITVGMLNSTDDLSYGNLSARTINGIYIKDEALPLMDLFNHSLMDEFYSNVESRITELRENGADIIVYYIHWGDEYHLTHNDMQDAIAQKLCDLGVDVIIGGHPHVIQDAEVLTSTTDPEHSTLCFYSLGNLVSNQNRLTMGDTMNKNYTENGLMVELTIRKYSTGETVVTKVDTIPLWVHRYYDSATAKMRYEIVPVEAALADPTAYGLYNSYFGVDHASAVSGMTNGLLGNICEVFASSVKLPEGLN